MIPKPTPLVPLARQQTGAQPAAKAVQAGPANPVLTAADAARIKKALGI
jgi:hypothetical protein